MFEMRCHMRLYLDAKQGFNSCCFAYPFHRQFDCNNELSGPNVLTSLCKPSKNFIRVFKKPWFHPTSSYQGKARFIGKRTVGGGYKKLVQKSGNLKAVTCLSNELLQRRAEPIYENIASSLDLLHENI